MASLALHSEVANTPAKIPPAVVQCFQPNDYDPSLFIAILCLLHVALMFNMQASPVYCILV